MSDRVDLSRFVDAQAAVFDSVLGELRAGRKRTHWMWFVFPQLRGLGRSPMAEHYGIASLAEARAYLEHPVLGPRLVACTTTVLDHVDVPLLEIFGEPDDLKFCSSMTLFAAAEKAAAMCPAGQSSGLFAQAIDRFCGGRPDQRTVALLETARER